MSSRASRRRHHLATQPPSAPRGAGLVRPFGRPTLPREGPGGPPRGGACRRAGLTLPRPGRRTYAGRGPSAPCLERNISAMWAGPTGPWRARRQQSHSSPFPLSARAPLRRAPALGGSLLRAGESGLFVARTAARTSCSARLTSRPRVPRHCVSFSTCWSCYSAAMARRQGVQTAGSAKESGQSQLEGAAESAPHRTAARPLGAPTGIRR